MPGITWSTPATQPVVRAQARQAQAPATPTAAPITTPLTKTRALAPAAQAATPKPSPKPIIAASSPANGSDELASEQQCAGQFDVSKTSNVLVCLTSYARTHNKLSGISANDALMAAAASKDQDMLACGYSHTACGKAFNYWMTSKGYAGRCTAENIAQGQTTPRVVFEAWMRSPGHRANILNGNYKHIGVAEVLSSNGPMWVMELGGC